MTTYSQVDDALADLKAADKSDQGQIATRKIALLYEILGWAGCECECNHGRDECGDECEPCMGCYIEWMLAGAPDDCSSARMFAYENRETKV